VSPKFGVDLSGVKAIASSLLMAGRHAKEMEDDLKKATAEAFANAKVAGKLKDVSVGIDPGHGDFTITAEFVLTEADSKGLSHLFSIGGKVPEAITPAELAAADKAFDDE
jgi:hypothetical protein